MIEIIFRDSRNFRSLLIKNVQMPKNQLHEAAIDAKKAIVAVLDQVTKAAVNESSRDLFLTLVKELFGPNSLTHFSVKRNQDLFISMASILNNEQIATYIEDTLIANFDNPDLSIYYPGDQSGPNKALEAQKMIQIKMFMLS